MYTLRAPGRASPRPFPSPLPNSFPSFLLTLPTVFPNHIWEAPNGHQLFFAPHCGKAGQRVGRVADGWGRGAGGNRNFYRSFPEMVALTLLAPQPPSRTLLYRYMNISVEEGWGGPFGGKQG